MAAQLTADERRLGPTRLGVDVAGHHLLPEPLSPVIRIEASDAATWSARRMTSSIAGSRTIIGRLSSVTAARTAAISSASGGSGMNSLAIPALIAAAAASGRRRRRRPPPAPDPLGLVGGDQARDVERVLDHHQVRALPGPQRVGRRFVGLDVRDLGPGVHRHLHGDRELSVQFSDDQEAHRSSPLGLFVPVVQLVKLQSTSRGVSRRRRRP